MRVGVIETFLAHAQKTRVRILYPHMCIDIYLVRIYRCKYEVTANSYGEVAKSVYIHPYFVGIYPPIFHWYMLTKYGGYSYIVYI